MRQQHHFQVLWSSKPELDRPITQLLFCQECNKKFWGFGGSIGKPEVLHEVHDNLNYAKYVSSSNVTQKSGTNIDKIF